MSSAYHKDILRSVHRGWKRFVSIMAITALGVAMLAGLYASCLDMYRSTDRFYREQRLFDIRILSTLGLTHEDVAQLAKIEGVEAAEGAYSETVHTQVVGVKKTAEVKVLSPTGMNRPYVMSGRMPTSAQEIAVTDKYMVESGKKVGDRLAIEVDEEDEEQTSAFSSGVYTITGVVLDPMDINSTSGAASKLRATAATDYAFYVPSSAAKNKIFTAVYLILSDTKELEAFSAPYDEAVLRAVQGIEDEIKVQRERARYDAVREEAGGKIKDAQDQMQNGFSRAEEQFADAHRQIDEAREKLLAGEAALMAQEQEAERGFARGRRELESGKQTLAQAEKELADGEEQLVQAERELEENHRQVTQGLEQLAQGRAEAEKQFEAAEKRFGEEQVKLNQGRVPLEGALSQLMLAYGPAWPQQEWDTLTQAAQKWTLAGYDENAIAVRTANESAALAAMLPPGQAANVIQVALGMGMVNGGQQLLDAQRKLFEEQKAKALLELEENQAELLAAQEQIAQGRRTLAEKRQELEQGKIDLAIGWDDLLQGENELAIQEKTAKQKLQDAWLTLEEGKAELAANEAELLRQEDQYALTKEEAQQKIWDAYGKLADIDMAQWYVQDRTSLDSYSGLSSDLSSIEAVGTVFPVIFLLIAILMSLTTMTRMVEEERGLIGVYKALGFGNGAIYRKYILFALVACIFGGLFGDVFGFVLMPRFVALVLDELYTVPYYDLHFDTAYGVGGVILFMVGIVGSTALACRSELGQMPAALMRPKAPKAGTRVLLEYVTPLWKRLTFLQKVTLRNLFRYKKRLFMTVGGIMGCTALILCGFAIKDSVADLAPKQYGTIYSYDLMAVFKDGDAKGLIRQLGSDRNVQESISLRIESAKLMNAREKTEKVQLMVIPKGGSLKGYIHLEGLDGKAAATDKKGVLITENAARMLGLSAGDTAFMQDMDLTRHEVMVSGVVKNYLGNNVYMEQSLYESLFGKYTANSLLANFSVDYVDHREYVQELLDRDGVLSAVSAKAVLEDYGFDLIDAIVVLITGMAGGLAFVVLFTLSNTNISERVRELATTKVLGFYDNEVHQYVNRETLILSLLGILLGLPLGRVISGFLTVALNMPSIHFVVTVEPISYGISAGITLCFVVVVNQMTNRTLNRINMVEALKSVE